MISLKKMVLDKIIKIRILSKISKSWICLNKYNIYFGSTSPINHPTNVPNPIVIRINPIIAKNKFV